MYSLKGSYLGPPNSKQKACWDSLDNISLNRNHACTCTRTPWYVASKTHRFGRKPVRCFKFLCDHRSPLNPMARVFSQLKADLGMCAKMITFTELFGAAPHLSSSFKSSLRFLYLSSSVHTCVAPSSFGRVDSYPGVSSHENQRTFLRIPS